MTNQYITDLNITFDYPFTTPLHRLIMVYIQISGSGDGGKEKIISDKSLLAFCCCTSSELIDAINFLLNEGFLEKQNYGYQFGSLSSGYTICIPDKLRKGDELINPTT